MSDYPLLDKYKAPVVKGCIDPSRMKEWLDTLPNDWSTRFGKVCGSTTQGGNGLYACDAEDTLWSLENGYSARRWNG